MDFVREADNGVFIQIKVIPKSRNEGFLYDRDTGVLKLRVRQMAVKGKANKRALELITDTFGECKIVSGGKTRRKTVLIKNATRREIEERLGKIDL